MKKWVLGLCLLGLVLVPARSFSLDDMDSEGISIKAGPTDITEELSLAWVEASLYPKVIERGREVFVEVRLASQVKNVKLALDTESGSFLLFSDNNKDWSRVLKIPPGASDGLHAAKITIIGKDGKTIQRTLDFVVKEDVRAGKNIPLTVLNVAQVVENGETVRQLLPGVQITALYKAPFYRVRLDDGREGWIEAARVKEPTEELYLMGFRAYEDGKNSEAIGYFNKALNFDPKHAQSHFYLAKIYWKQNNIEKAASEIKESLSSNPDNPKARRFADAVAQTCLDRKDYSKVFDLKPRLLVDRLNDRAKEKMIIASVPIKRAEIKTAMAPAPAVSKSILADTINIVKVAKTGKGSSISNAIASVLSLTKSLGTRIQEDGWKVAAVSDGLKVVYACRQERSGKFENENFEWKIDQDRRTVVPLNDNARLLMNRW